MKVFYFSFWDNAESQYYQSSIRFTRRVTKPNWGQGPREGLLTFLRSYFSTFTNWIRLSTSPLNISKFLTRNLKRSAQIVGPPRHQSTPIFFVASWNRSDFVRSKIFWRHEISKILWNRIKSVRNHQIKLEVKSNWSLN